MWPYLSRSQGDVLFEEGKKSSGRADMTESLGFMGRVKTEVEYLYDLLRTVQYHDKELGCKRPLRLCVMIDDLDSTTVGNKCFFWYSTTGVVLFLPDRGCDGALWAIRKRPTTLILKAQDEIVCVLREIFENEISRTTHTDTAHDTRARFSLTSPPHLPGKLHAHGSRRSTTNERSSRPQPLQLSSRPLTRFRRPGRSSAAASGR